MSRTNLIMLGIVLALVGIYFAIQRPDPMKRTESATRIFPGFNKEAVDRIVLSGGWRGSEYSFERLGSAWSLTLPGAREGYPIKADEIANFIDAVSNLRRENPAGESDSLRQDTQTGEPFGRLVEVFKGSEPIARFRAGKNPKQGWEYFFIRREEEKAIYRTRTILTKDLDKTGGTPDPFGGGGAVRGYDWKNFTTDLSRWVDPQIWSLGTAEVVEIKLHRSDLDVSLVRLADEKWEVRPVGDAEPFLADTAAVDDIKSRVNYLSFEEVVSGTGDAQLKEYGLDSPEITLVLKLKKKIEPKPEGAPPAEGEEKKPAAEPEYKEMVATITVGRKVKVKDRFEEEEQKVTEEEYYAIRVAGDLWENPQQEKREGFIFLVSDYKVASLKKTLEELRQKAPETPDEPSEPTEPEDPEAPEDVPDEPDEPDEPEKTEPADPCGCGCGCDG